MKKLGSLLIALLVLVAIPVALAQAEHELHLYLDIPFEAFSFQELSQRLLEQKQVVLEQPFSTADAHHLQEFGIAFQFSAFYGPNDVVKRIVLSPEGEAFADEAHIRQLVEQQVQQFVLLDQQLTQLYGEPDIRFFWAGDGKYQMNMSEAFKPANNAWTAGQLMHVFDSDRILRARSVWNNVILEFWPNGVKKHPRGYLTKLTLSYENQPVNGPVQTLFEYPVSQ